jgi:hypothetical protein
VRPLSDTGRRLIMHGGCNVRRVQEVCGLQRDGYPAERQIRPASTTQS